MCVGVRRVRYPGLLRGRGWVMVVSMEKSNAQQLLHPSLDRAPAASLQDAMDHRRTMRWRRHAGMHAPPTYRSPLTGLCVVGV